MKDLQKLINEIAKWSDATFGEGQRSLAISHHLKKEVDELIESIQTFQNGNTIKNRNSDEEMAKVFYEFADCFMLILDAVHHFGMSATLLCHYTEKKLEINKKRKWGKPDNNGVVEHIKKLPEKLFSKKDVIQIIHDLLEMLDILIDATGNENTDWDAESILQLIISDTEIDDNITMFKDSFHFPDDIEHTIGLAECPNCGDAVVWNDGCVKCNANFIFKDSQEKEMKHFQANEVPVTNDNEDDGEYTYEVGVVINNEHFKGYVEVETKKWHVDYGGISVGHRQTDEDEIDYWYYLPKDDLSGVDCPNCKTPIDECKCIKEF